MVFVNQGQGGSKQGWVRHTTGAAVYPRGPAPSLKMFMLATQHGSTETRQGGDLGGGDVGGEHPRGGGGNVWHDWGGSWGGGIWDSGGQDGHGGHEGGKRLESEHVDGCYLPVTGG